MRARFKVCLGSGFGGDFLQLRVVVLGFLGLRLRV